MGKRGMKPTRPCGTVAAYKRHSRAGEETCDACKAAWAAHQRVLSARRRERRGIEAVAEEWSRVAM